MPRKILTPIILILATFLSVLSLTAQDDARVKALLEKVTSSSADTRFASRSEAAQVGAPAVAPLAKLIGEVPEAIKEGKQRLEVAITARAALERAVHHAGRPGADAERKAVAAELAGVLAGEPPAKVKREVLHLIAHVAGDDEVSRVAKLLDDADKNVRETARLALERIPGPASLSALVEAAKGHADERKPDLLFSIGKKGQASAVPFLVETAGKSRGKTRLAALESLARLGAPESVPAFEAALAEQDLPERAPLYNEYLRLADNLLASKRADPARRIYREALAKAPADHQRERALFQLTQEGGPSGIEAILSSLGDPGERVRKLALARLAASTGLEVLAALEKAYESAKPEARPALLRAIAEKDRAAAAPLLAEAAGSTQPDLKITALDIEGKLDNADLEPVYLKSAESGSPQIKPVAMRGYLAVAKKRLASGDKAHALSMYGRAIEIATSDDERAEALRGVISAGDPKAIGIVAGLLKDPILGTEAARGFVAFAAQIGAAGDKDTAESRLKSIVTGDFPRDVRGQAAGELRKLGRDPQKLILSQGYVVNWWLVGPMDNGNRKGLETKYFPEDVIDLVNEQRIEARRFRWQEYKDVSLDGVIDLVPVFRRSDDRVAYAYTELESPAAREVLFKMGSDDGIACWLNGERIHLNNASRGLKVDEDSVKAKLKAGKNKVLLKISNSGGTWAFVFRVTELDGKPVDGSRGS